MQEALKTVTSATIEEVKKSVTLCLKSNCINLNGTWTWEMQTTAIYCSDVMSFPVILLEQRELFTRMIFPNCRLQSAYWKIRNSFSWTSASLLLTEK